MIVYMYICIRSFSGSCILHMIIYIHRHRFFFLCMHTSRHVYMCARCRFFFWFHTGFIKEPCFTITKDFIDMASADKRCKVFSETFKVCIFMRIGIYTCMRECMYVYAQKRNKCEQTSSMCVCMHAVMCVCMCVCMYVYIYIYIYIYIHTYRCNPSV
jgi:hypothetical protein